MVSLQRPQGCAFVPSRASPHEEGERADQARVLLSAMLAAMKDAERLTRGGLRPSPQARLPMEAA